MTDNKDLINVTSGRTQNLKEMEERRAKPQGQVKKKEYLNRQAKVAKEQTPFTRQTDCERLLPQ